MDKRGVLEHDITPTAGMLLIELLSSDQSISCYMKYVRICME